VALLEVFIESVPRQKCKKWLTFQWAAVNPELIVCFGRVALGVLVGSEEKAKSVAPNTFVDTKFGKVLFQNHPAFFMREKNIAAKAYGFAKVASTLEKALDYIGLPI
jgi:uracil-DNA glycosylase